MQLTILFQAPYWVGILEDTRADGYYVARYIFGSEPSDAEVYVFVQHDLLRLLDQMTVGLPADMPTERPKNPKRVQREMRRAIQTEGIASKAQEALRLQIEANKKTRQTRTRAEQAAAAAHQWQQHLAKKKAKQQGH